MIGLEEALLRVTALLCAGWATGFVVAMMVNRQSQYFQASLALLLGALIWVLELIGNAIYAVLTIVAKTVGKLRS